MKSLDDLKGFEKPTKRAVKKYTSANINKESVEIKEDTGSKGYKYFVSFYWQKNSAAGFGNCVFDMPDKIRSIIDINAMAIDVCRQEHANSVTILNYKELIEEDGR